MKALLLITILAGLSPQIVMGQDQATLRKKQFNLEGNLAITGFDPVAYFKSGKAIKGKKNLAVSHQGVERQIVIRFLFPNENASPVIQIRFQAETL